MSDSSPSKLDPPFPLQEHLKPILAKPRGCAEVVFAPNGHYFIKKNVINKWIEGKHVILQSKPHVHAILMVVWLSTFLKTLDISKKQDRERERYMHSIYTLIQA